MSVNRENVIWQSPDGTWNRGFYAYYNVNEDDPDWDYEWDVEYCDDFDWISLGHATKEAAYESWDGANPGGSWTVKYDPENPEQTERFEQKARDAIAKGVPNERHAPRGGIMRGW